MLSSAALQHFQHAAIKGANGNHLRRLLYAVMMQHVVRGLTFIVLLMDQSNAYGQVNGVAMRTIVREEPLVMWTWFQAAFLYSHLVVYVHTPLGLTKGYRLAGGCMRGGGGGHGPLLVHLVCVSPSCLVQDASEGCVSMDATWRRADGATGHSGRHSDSGQRDASAGGRSQSGSEAGTLDEFGE